MYRYIVSYEPMNFKGRLGNYPMTVEYGKKMQELRLELREYLWDGQFMDTCGAEVRRANGNRHRYYSVFISKKTGKRCIVISNYDAKEALVVTIVFDVGDVSMLYRSVDDTRWQPVSGEMSIPPNSAVVALEISL
jgi:hypothetical protein